MRVEPRWLVAAAVGFVLAGIGLGFVSDAIRGAWQLNVWRVDLDDFLSEMVQFGFLVVAFVALRRQRQRTEEAHTRIDVNGDALEKKIEAEKQALEDKVAAQELALQQALEEKERALLEQEEHDIASLHARIRALEEQ